MPVIGESTYVAMLKLFHIAQRSIMMVMASLEHTQNSQVLQINVRSMMVVHDAGFELNLRIVLRSMMVVQTAAWRQTWSELTAFVGFCPLNAVCWSVATDS